MTAEMPLSNVPLGLPLAAMPGVNFSPVTVCPDAPVEEAIALINDSPDSCVVVTQKHCPVGIFTAHDLIRLLADSLGAISLGAIAQPISAVMSSNLVTILSFNIQTNDEQGALSLLQTMLKHQLHHLPIVNEQDRLVGLATQDALQTALLRPAMMQPAQMEKTMGVGEALPTETGQGLLQESKQKQIELQQINAQIGRSYRELTDTNQKLTHTLSKLQSVEYSLQQTNADLESRVALRTAELYQSERQWQSLLDNVQLAVIGLDASSNVTYANPFFLKISGYTAAEVMGKDWLKRFIPPSERAKITQYFQQLGNQPGAPLQYQNTILTRSGEVRSIVWNNTVLYDTNNNSIGTMSIGEDITERSGIDRMKGEFVAMVSHELRTPLTAIHGGLKLLAQGIVPSDSESGQHLLQVAAQNSQRLVRLVDDILALERLESGKSPLHKQRVDTQTVTAQVVEIFQPLAQSSNVTIELSDPGIAVLADSDRLVQVLTNLIDNALKFAPKDSAVQIAASRITEAVQFSVCDRGAGIPLQQQHRIFDRFVQVDTTGVSEKGGTGLGLTICQNIVEQHGGKIWVESTPGEGCCFYFTLPTD